MKEGSKEGMIKNDRNFFTWNGGMNEWMQKKGINDLSLSATK